MSHRDVATTPDALRELSARVHDLWFNLEHVDYAPDRGDVTIPLLSGKTRGERFGWESVAMSAQAAGTLIIRTVRSMAVDDAAQVRDYEIDHLTTTDGDRTVQLHATIPLRIDFHVDRVEVELLPSPRA